MSLLDIANAVPDMPDKASGGGDFEPPRAGVALFRMSSVIEVGIVKSEWKGVEKLNKKVIVEFELLHPDHAIKNDQGEIIRYHTMLVYLNKSGFSKAKYMKLFNKLNYDGSVHVEKNSVPPMARFLGKGFLGHIHHNPSKDGKKTYINLTANGSDDFTIGAPRVPLQDEMGVPTGKYKEIPVPAMHMAPRLFLWEPQGVSDEQYSEMWASIHMDGKNWFQEQIMGPENTDWEGSRAQELFQNHQFQPTTEPVEVEEEDSWAELQEETPEPVVTAPVVEEAKPKKRKRRTKAEMRAFREQQAKANGQATPAPASDTVVDPLEALGL